MGMENRLWQGPLRAVSPGAGLCGEAGGDCAEWAEQRGGSHLMFAEGQRK